MPCTGFFIPPKLLLLFRRLTLIIATEMEQDCSENLIKSDALDAKRARSFIKRERKLSLVLVFMRIISVEGIGASEMT